MKIFHTIPTHLLNNEAPPPDSEDGDADNNAFGANIPHAVLDRLKHLYEDAFPNRTAEDPYASPQYEEPFEHTPNRDTTHTESEEAYTKHTPKLKSLPVHYDLTQPILPGTLSKQSKTQLHIDVQW